MKRIWILTSSLLLLCLLAGCQSKAVRELIAEKEESAQTGSASTSSRRERSRSSNGGNQAAEASEAVPLRSDDSPIPDKDTFIRLHNEAAGILGGSLVDESQLDVLIWGGHTQIPGGFLFSEYGAGTLIFEPDYIRITGRYDRIEENIKEYAAVAVAVTGASAADALQAMTELLQSAELEERSNGYVAEEGEIQLEGVTFTIEIGQTTNIVQFWVNPAGLANSREKYG